MWKRDQIRDMLKICWNKREVFNSNDFFELNLIDIKKLFKDETLSSTFIQTIWSNDVKTWKIWINFKRFWFSNFKKTDEQILTNACYFIYRHNEWKNEKRKMLNRLSISIEFLQRFITFKLISLSQIKLKIA